MILFCIRLILKHTVYDYGNGKKNHIFKVIDSSDKDAEPVAVEVKDYIPKVVITVGYAGYLLLATESIEGLIIPRTCRPFPGNSVYSCRNF